MRNQICSLSLAGALSLSCALAWSADSVTRLQSIAPEASQLEELGTVSRIDVATSTLWVNGRALRVRANSAVFVGSARLGSLSDLKLGQRVSFSAMADGTLNVLQADTEGE